MPHFNIHYFTAGGVKSKDCIEAASKTEVKELFAESVRFDGNKYFDCRLDKVVGPLGRERTNKQKLATTYRFAMGTLMAAETHINQLKFESADIKEMARLQQLVNGAKKNISNAKRDLRDLIIRLGIHVK